MNYSNQKMGMIADPLSACTNAEPKSMTMRSDRPVATPAVPSSHYNEMGFAYLFRNKEIDESTVKHAMLAEDGVVRYSQELALAENRAVAVVLFRCAQLVFRGRCELDPQAIKLGGQFIIQGSRIHTGADLSGEEVRSVMQHLTNIGVFTSYIGHRSGEMLFDDWYTFSDENEYFPAYGQAKFN